MSKTLRNAQIALGRPFKSFQTVSLEISVGNGVYATVIS